MLLSVRTLVRWRVAAGRQFSPSQPLLRGPASPLLLQHASLSLSASTENSSGGRVAAAADATAGTSSSTTSTSEPPEWLQAAGSQRDSHRADVHVVLVNPKIPQNTGNVARSCAATGVGLHLVGPLGFALDERKLKRAGLDYWGAVCVKVHDSWQAFYDYFQQQQGPKRLVAYTVYGNTYYAGPEFSYQPGDWLLFGSETTGLPLEAHDQIRESGGELVKIPILGTHVRSLNLSVSVGVGLFEALRQLDGARPGGHSVEARAWPPLPQVAASYKEAKEARSRVAFSVASHYELPPEC